LTLHILHPSCYSCYQPCEQWRMMKGLDCDYETLNITMVICDTYILQRLTKSWWWRQTFEMITTTSPLVTLITLAQMYNTYLLQTRGHANCRRWSCWTREWHVTSHWCSVSSDPAMATNFVTKLFSSSPWNNVSIKYILHEKLVYQLIHSVFLYLLSPVASINRTIN
jgi:hypothetical protein